MFLVAQWWWLFDDIERCENKKLSLQKLRLFRVVCREMNGG
jgi:hypothetical protein